ncbi:hypothetical protein PVAND_003277 [Polypedilum vanderplanki]|uniref:Uncharacterized protein n=1 Tax=Polypedilum vanderplanki TaxID=319348 RepID=A0A9J6BUJ9_POLVA|nr:hypothetical protein PVAND_003277 [Polypedilum vanderplanki]
MKLTFEEYCKSSTIHGFKYLSKKYDWIEKIFWVFSLLTSLTLTLILISQLINKIKTVPIIISILEKSIPISEIDFPAVTLCQGLIQDLSNHKEITYFQRHSYTYSYYDNDEVFEITKDEEKFNNISYLTILDKIEKGEIKLEELGNKILKRLQVIDLLTHRGVFARKNFHIPTIDFLDVINEFRKYSIFKYPVSYEYASTDNVISSSESITNLGVCFSFNNPPYEYLLDSTKVSDDFKYELFIDRKIEKNQTFIAPIRSKLVNNMLMVTFSTDLTVTEINNHIDGGIMYIHDPYELPSSFSKIMSMNTNANIEIYLEPQYITIDESLYDANISERNCYHSDERQLKIFKVYTKNNCLVECLTEFMIRKCGCVEFFMIRNYTTRICSASEKECFDNAQQEFYNYLNSCNCLESCSYIKYVLDIVKKPNIYDNFYDNESFTQINIKYKNSLIDEIVRKRQFNEVDFLSFVGGLLNLFAGFSALSFIEILYWAFAARIYDKLKIKNTSLVYPLGTQFSFKTSKKFTNVPQKFFKNSSAHGLLYLDEESSFKKFFWMIFIAISLSLCFTMIIKVKDELSHSYIVGYDDEMTFDEEVF